MPARPALVAAVAVSLLLPGATLAVAPSDPPAGYQPGMLGIELEPFAEGLESPLFLTPDGTGDGRLYVVEQGGAVRVVSPDGTVAPEPFLDLRGRISAGGEEGLLGLAFHPDYAANGRLYVYYSAQGGGAQLVTELRAVDGVVDPASERLVLRMADFAGNHNGGMLAFDQEGMLLIGTGDGGGGGDPEGNGQDDTQPLGKLLRIDVDGGDPYGAPVNDPEGRLGPDALPEIRATGLRNPWRFSVDSATGDLFIGDVGQGEWEEVDVLPAGQGGWDFGWSVMEGPDCFGAETCDQEGLTLPVAAYSHSEGDGCTIIGGYVYRGAAFPALTGAYLFGDLCSDKLWALSAADAVATGAATAEEVGSFEGTLSSFGQDESGELYATDLDGGRVYRLTAVER
ncbi:MAG: PQQ-dependent sugar dehydrogenase [Candidatus Limnocylindrales bacterium]